jgi:heat shock protein HtpX
MKRVLLFIATNLAVILVLSVVARLLGIDAYLAARGGDLGGLLVFAALFGFGGALISLAISKWTAKRAMGVRVIEQPTNPTEQWLVSTVRAQAQAAGIGMPEVGVFDSPEPNAFATGARRDAALVAVSTGLLQRMDRKEVEAVLGHEVSHVANGDMVTLTLIQGVVNTFVIFLSRIIGNIVDRAVFRSENGQGIAYFATVLVTQFLLGILASMIVMWFSRYREFRADAGGAKLAGTSNMIGALERLRLTHERASDARRATDPREPNTGLPEAMRAFGISGRGAGGGLRRLFMSHPPLEERIAALRATGGAL